MTDETETPAAPPETSGDAPTQPNVAAQSAIATQRARRAAPATKRAPKIPATDPVAAADDAQPEYSLWVPDAAQVAAVAPKKKKPSGKKKTRAELLAIVKDYEKLNGKLPKDEKNALVAAANDPKVQEAYARPPITQNPEAMAKLSSGVSRAAVGLSRIIARRRGAHWLFDKTTEADVIGDATADCLVAIEEMFPGMVWLQTAVKLAPFGILAGALYETIDSRLEVDAQIAGGEKPRIMLVNDVAK